MLDEKRNYRTSYVVKVLNGYDEDAWVNITMYKEEAHSTIKGTYLVSSVPKWMLDSMKVLDAAAEDGGANIPGFGVLLKGDYWFMAEQTKY